MEGSLHGKDAGGKDFNAEIAMRRSRNQKEESGILTTETPRHREKKAVGSLLCASVPLWFMQKSKETETAQILNLARLGRLAGRLRDGFGTTQNAQKTSVNQPLGRLLRL